MRAPDRLILMGVFGAPQGVRGETRIKSLTRDPKAIGAYGPLTDQGARPRLRLQLPAPRQGEHARRAGRRRHDA